MMQPRIRLAILFAAAVLFALAGAPIGRAQPLWPPATDGAAAAPAWRYGGRFAASTDAATAAPRAEMLALDTFSGAPRLSVTGGLPRTAMGDPFDAVDPGMPLEITRVELYLASTAAQSYANGLCARVQFWNDHDIEASPVFTNPAGRVQKLLVGGPVSLAPNVYYVIAGAMTPPVPLAELAGNGVVVSFQGDDGAGCIPNDNLTSLVRFIEEPDQAPVAVGAIPLDAPRLGFFRNASQRPDFNFEPGDLRYLQGTNSNAIAIRLYAAAPEPPRTVYLPLLLVQPQ